MIFNLVCYLFIFNCLMIFTLFFFFFFNSSFSDLLGVLSMGFLLKDTCFSSSEELPIELVVLFLLQAKRFAQFLKFLKLLNIVLNICFHF